MWAWVVLALLPIVIQQPARPYHDFSKGGSGFYGSGRELPDPVDIQSVRIGILAPQKDPEGLQMRNGVLLALEEANRKGGYRKIPYEAVFRADDGPWGVVASRVVELANEDKVWTIIGGLDGNRTHIAELVVAKAWVPVISPGASDSSIDYANVPWVFRCVPADARQADAMLAFAKQRGYKEMLVLSEIAREAHTGFLRLRRRAIRQCFPLAAHHQFPTANPMEVIPRLQGMDIDAVIVWGSPNAAIPLIRGLRDAGITAPVLGPAALAAPEVAGQAGSLGEVIVAAPFDLSREDAQLLDFVERYKGRNGIFPSPVAFYAYDAARMVVKAMEATGLNRARIRDELAQMSFDGITGKIEFDSLRGNTAQPVLMTLKNGRWRRLD